LGYGDFEGVIPEGNYGAGAVIVWDRGVWVPLEDPHQGMEKGKLLFELRGYKLHGKWTLVKLKKGEKEWLLIKEKDGHVSQDGALPPESVLSGLTVEELKEGKDRAEPIKKELARLKVFDLLGFDGYAARPVPLVKRKATLQRVLPHAGPLRYLEHCEKDGEALSRQVVKMGLGGIVAKQADSPYRAGRAPHWLKTR